MFSVNSLALVSLLSTLASGVLAQNGQVSYAACMDSAPTDIATSTANVAGFDNCASICQNGGYRYAYALITAAPDTLDCACSNVGPTADQYSTAVDSKMTCSAIQWNALITYTTYSTPTCYTGYDPTSNPAGRSSPPPITVNGHIQCFDYCANNNGATLVPSVTGSDYTCTCDNNGGDVNPNMETACTRGALARFAGRAPGTNTGFAPAGQSVWVKRQLREQLRLDSQKLQKVCPEEGRACLIGKGEDSWECVDVQTELESCGGCMHGEFAALGEVSTGIDCTALPGVSMGGVTCTHGQCAIWACDPGFKLKGRECVAEK